MPTPLELDHLVDSEITPTDNLFHLILSPQFCHERVINSDPPHRLDCAGARGSARSAAGRRTEGAQSLIAPPSS